MTAFDIDGDLVRKLAGLLDETGLAEIEFAEGDRRIRVTRATIAAAAPLPAGAPAPGPAAEPGAGGPTPAGAVTSPMVGTAYLAPEPGAAPFVKPGDSVSVGDTLLIIEAMKVMNPIRAPHAGTVRQVVIKDAQPVEYGDVLMVVE
jgi:acetyl-CoA carboxylase biotin carboxyl carrier protein